MINIKNQQILMGGGASVKYRTIANYCDATHRATTL